MNWPDLVARYQEWLEHSSGRSPATIRRYGDYLLSLGKWYSNPPDEEKLRPRAPGPEQATTDDLELFAGLVAHHRGLSPRSRMPLIAAMKSFYKWAGRRAGLRGNPAANLVYPDAGRRLPVPATIETAEKLLMQPDVSTLMGLRDAAIIATLVGTGIRISGLVGMNESALLWAEIDQLRVLDIKVKEKGGRERIVPVPSEAQVLIRAYLAHPELEAVDRQLKNADRVLWISTRNNMVGPHDYRGERRRLGPKAVREMIIKYGERAGCPRDHLHPHAFRHLFGTQLAEHDVDPFQRMALMGHADIKSTEVYTHLALKKLRETSKRSNPLRDIRAPVLDSAREIHRRRGSL